MNSTLRSLVPFASLAGALLLAAGLGAQEISPTEGIDLPVLGQVAPRAAKDIASSPWSIGAETIDRDFTVYAAFKDFLGPLGAKGVRLQAGWAKCERTKGVYSWGWLDAIVDDAVAQGVRPWLEFSYGNTLYAGGGDTGLGGGFPTSPEALAAWDRWCRALVERYRDRVTEWEIWNEPDLSRAGRAAIDAYVGLYVRTAEIVRAAQPKGRLRALALAGNLDYADQFLAGMKARGKLGLVDELTFHGYPRNPDDTTPVDKLRALLAKHGATASLRQGETGAPSKLQENFALKNLPFTETIQAKWDARRLLAHRAKDVPVNLFTLSDMHYSAASPQGGVDGVVRMNYKGLLGTHPDRTVSHVKPAYRAAQTVFTVFDDTLRRLPGFPSSSTAARSLALTGYQRDPDGAQVVALWFGDAPPGEASRVSPVDVTLPAGRFTAPVLVDVRTGTVYAVPPDRWTQGAGGAVFRALPLYDSPMLLAERALVGLRSVAR
ncbi:MAG: hypothetical protein NTV51_15245 [Verrucomicrobia bacterium]|nr:hypothetical protein [Verrucomicrobiota bacterium]